MSPATKVIGVGSPIMDLLAQVPDALVEAIPGAKGGMELVGPGDMAALVGRLDTPPDQAPGGSAANTIFALARMGLPAAFLGKLGEDAMGRRYRSAFAAVGGDCGRFKSTDASPTARCLSLITPDSERTLRTDLGAAALLDPDEVSTADFSGCSHAHVEGYLLFNPALAESVLTAAKSAGCTVSLDLGSFEVVRAAGAGLAGLLERYVDAVFANEDEAAAFLGRDDPEAALEALGDLCRVAAVKVGPAGAYLKESGETCFVEALRVDRVVDSTAAGDFWAAGFLYGHLHGYALPACGRLGARLGGEVVQEVGAHLGAAAWERVRAEMDAVS